MGLGGSFGPSVEPSGRASVPPATFHKPVSPTGGPQFTVPSGQRGVGRTGGAPGPPRPPPRPCAPPPACPLAPAPPCPCPRSAGVFALASGAAPLACGRPASIALAGRTALRTTSLPLGCR